MEWQEIVLEEKIYEEPGIDIIPLIDEDDL